MEQAELTRDIEAIQVPGGHTVTLEKGWDVVITQSLGGSYTVQVPAYGGLFRIAGRDADALGKEPTTAPASAAGGGAGGGGGRRGGSGRGWRDGRAPPGGPRRRPLGRRCRAPVPPHGACGAVGGGRSGVPGGATRPSRPPGR